MRIIFLGDVVGAPGRQGVTRTIPRIRQERSPDLIVANGENIKHGSGITEELYRALRDGGVDGVTLGDHALRDRRIIPTLERADEPITIPFNLPARSPGQRILKLTPAAGEWQGTGVSVITVLGRVFMNGPSDEPFGAIERALEKCPSTPGRARPIVIVEAHMEATAEKIALAHFLDGRVTAVVGSHTHVPTADARLLPKGTAYITDVGMCGPYDSVIGRDKDAVVTHMSAGLPTQFDVASGDVRVCGCQIDIDPLTGRAVAIERVEWIVG